MEKNIFLADSCAGGLGILKFFLDWAGDYSVSYLADGEKNPFGLKSKQEIIEIVKSWLEYFNKNKKYGLFCISCNTASISIEKEIRLLEKKYKIPIITMVDGAKSMISKNKDNVRDKRVLLIGTKFTISSGVYRQVIIKEKPEKLFELDGTLSERFVARGLENNRTARKEMIHELSRFKNEKVETIFLGCTCYPFIAEDIKEIYGKNICLLDPAKEVSELARKAIDGKTKKKNIMDCHFYITGNRDEWNNNLNIIFKRIFREKIRAETIFLDR